MIDSFPHSEHTIFAHKLPFQLCPYEIAICTRANTHLHLLSIIRPLVEQKRGLAATRTRGLSHVYLGTLSENHTTRPQDLAVLAIDEMFARLYKYIDIGVWM